MATCQNCGAVVSAAYVRVFAPDGMEDVRVCPHCEDKIRDGAEIRKARTSRNQ